MSHVTKSLPWCTIDINLQTGQVFLQLRWQYVWIAQAGQPAWSYAERRRFHTDADLAVWASWSNSVRLDVVGNSIFARKFAAQGIPINLDVRWVTSDPHWTVTVTKIPPGAHQQSSVIWAARTIRLDSNDTAPRITGSVPGAGGAIVNFRQTPVAHEFGHVAGNTAVLARGDEYPAGNANQVDRASIMNWGNELRNRHFRTILDEMNTMMPDTVFSVKSIN